MYQPKQVVQDVHPLNVKCIFVCPFCKDEIEVVVSKKGFDDYYNEGRLAQHALSELSIDIRELFISGVCDKCY